MKTKKRELVVKISFDFKTKLRTINSFALFLMKLFFFVFILNFICSLFCHSENLSTSKEKLIPKNSRASLNIHQIAECKINSLRRNLLTQNKNFRVGNLSSKQKSTNWTKFLYNVSYGEKSKTIKICVPDDRKKKAWISQYCVFDSCEYGQSRNCKK